MTKKYHPPLEEWQLLLIVIVAYLTFVIGGSILGYNIWG